MASNTRRLVATLVGSLLIFNLSTLTASQDFQDLNNNNSNQQQQSAANHHKQTHQQQHSQHTFQSFNRQQTQPQQFSQPPQTTTSSRHSMQRPMLSNRFSPQVAGQTSGTTLSAQASTSATVFASPSASSTANSSPAHSSSGANSVELLMKNALARTAQLGAPEARQDTPGLAGDSQSEASSSVSVTSGGLARSSSSISSIGSQQSSSTQQIASESSLAPTPASAVGESSLSLDDLSSEKPGNHETVYSDQRFANLFARRNNAKKSRIQPTEQVKAKPTLPSFIKSPPDPKQFTAAQAAAATQDRIPASSANSNTFASQQRFQQANQQLNRANLANQQLKKSAVTSNSATLANNKRNNALNAKAGASNGGSLAASSTNGSSNSPKSISNQKGVVSTSTSKPAQLANNPFNRAQGSNSDPANVIAMARKRLLANNALESAKLKQQQTKPTLQTK